MKLRHIVAGGLLAWTALQSSLLQAASDIQRPAMTSSKASRSLLLDITQAGTRLVAVGDRGHILISNDQGATWQQAKTPASVMLTAVNFADAKRGWAVGHQGVILHTQDGGMTWSLQRADGKPEQAPATACQEQQIGVPLLDVWFASAEQGYAVGAYGYFLETRDGGRSWAAVDDRLQNPDCLHLNAISAGEYGPRPLFIAGESGLIFRSLDLGASWASLPSPFAGSFFGVASFAPDLTLVFGLEGQLYRSANQGSSWTAVPTGVTVGLNGAAMTANGRLIVVGNAGQVLTSRDRGLSFTAQAQEDRQTIAAVVAQRGQLITAGEGGVKTLPDKK